MPTASARADQTAPDTVDDTLTHGLVCAHHHL